MTSTYHLTLDGGTAFDVRAESAGEAIFKAMHQARGRSIETCYLGNEATLTEDAGRITFEIPPHKALPVEPRPGRQILCATYVRAGDVLHLGVFDYEIDEIILARTQFSFRVHEKTRPSRETDFRYAGATLLTVTRPEPFAELANAAPDSDQPGQGTKKPDPE